MQDAMSLGLAHYNISRDSEEEFVEVTTRKSESTYTSLKNIHQSKKKKSNIENESSHLTCEKMTTREHRRLTQHTSLPPPPK